MGPFGMREALFIFLLVLHLLISSFPSKAGTSSYDEEAAALLNWKASFANRNNSLLISWNFQPTKAKNSSNHCTWTGVSCIDGSINRLNLTNSNINGTLYNFPFSSLQNLEYVDLSMNELFGSIPPEFSSLKSVESLDLSHNNLSGFIPKALGELPGSLHIDISFNDLQGPIPTGRAFVNITIEQLKGNKGLCGNITGLQACQSPQLLRNSRRQKRKKLVLKIVLPVLGSLALICALIGLLRTYEQRKKDAKVEILDVKNQDLFSITTYDGRAVYREIIKATEEFNEILLV